MILRKARLGDFDVFKTLYLDEDDGKGYHWIYFGNKHAENSDNEQTKMTVEEYFGKEFLKILDEELHSYSIETFKEDLKNEKILIAENDESEIIGYIRMFPCGNNTYKIAEWAMFDPDNKATRLQMLRELLKIRIPRLRKFSISVINDEAKALLQANGFVQSGATGFFTYEVVKKKKTE